MQISKITSFTKIFYKYFKALYICNFSSFKTQQKKEFKVSISIEGSFLLKKNFVLNEKILVLGEGLIDKNTLLSNPIYKSKKSGFFIWHIKCHQAKT